MRGPRYSGIGGNTPQSLLNQACVDIQAGRADAVLLAGAETWRTRMRLRARGIRPDWTKQDESVPVPPGGEEKVPMSGPGEDRIGLTGCRSSTRFLRKRCGWPTATSDVNTAAASANCGLSSVRWRGPTRARLEP